MRLCPPRLFRFVGTLLCCTGLFAQTVVSGSKRTAHAPVMTTGEARASAAFAAAKALGSPELYAFLRPMPKGGDLHLHLSGAVYAETFIAEAAADGLCLAPVDGGTPAVPEGQHAVRLTGPEHGTPNQCAAGEVPAGEAMQRQALYDDLVDSFSMRAFVPTEGISGHDQFFATFDRFGGLKDHAGEWLDEVARRAATQNEQYLEVMQTPTFSHAAALGYKLGWPEQVNDANHRTVLAKLRDHLLANGLRDEVAVDRQQLAAAQAVRLRLEGATAVVQNPIAPNSPCGSRNCTQGLVCPVPASGTSAPCDVQVRWIYQILRGFPPQQVFAQTLLGFEVAQAELESGDPQVVGINLVMPEDGQRSMHDYHLQMLMLEYLHGVYPRVRITLHAGELAFGMVPPDGLRFHIREAVELGHAERIGHGMDVLYEDDPNGLLRQMSARHVMVEVNLTSNDVILGKTRTDHPLAAYRAAHVPVALATDDEGVSRIDLTHEYVKAAEEQNLSYMDLKRSARTSLEHSFAGGDSLWAAPDVFTARVPACAGSIGASSSPGARCAALLNHSPRAALQWELERRFAAFEAGSQ